METDLLKLNPHWLSSGGEGVTISATGEPAPLVEYAALGLDCPCGCDSACCIPVTKGYGHQWHIQGDSYDFATLTLTPSIQRVGGCNTHFFITNGKITL